MPVETLCSKKFDFINFSLDENFAQLVLELRSCCSLCGHQGAAGGGVTAGVAHTEEEEDLWSHDGKCI